MLISDKIDFKTKAIKKNKGHYLMIKGLIQEEDITLVNIYAPNIEAPKYIQQMVTDIKGEIDGNTVGEIDGNTIVAGDFNIPLTSMERSSRQKINKAIEILNDTIEKLHLIDIFRTLHPKNSEYTFKCIWNILKDWPHIGAQKTNLNKFKSIKIISSIFSDHNGIKLEINHRKKKKKIEKTNYMETKQHAIKKSMGQWGNQNGN